MCEAPSATAFASVVATAAIAGSSRSVDQANVHATMR